MSFTAAKVSCLSVPTKLVYLAVRDSPTSSFPIIGSSWSAMQYTIFLIVCATTYVMKLNFPCAIYS